MSGTIPNLISDYNGCSPFLGVVVYEDTVAGLYYFSEKCLVSYDRPSRFVVICCMTKTSAVCAKKRSHMCIIIQMNNKYIITTLDLHILWM